MHKQTINYAKTAQKEIVTGGRPSSVYGIKGLNWSMFLPKFDIIEGVGIDYLHNTLLGVVKMLVKLWFNKSYKKEPWYMGNNIKEIDRKIQNLCLPNIISRVPRNIEKDISQWNGSEFRSFLLFYSVPILYDYMPETYFQHYILLVESVFLLLKDSISTSDLQKSSKMLKHFCVRLRSLYGSRYQTYNVHNLLHMSMSVYRLGPLWCQSAFWYEDYNGDYKNLFHGTQNINLQIVTNVIAQHKIPEIARVLIPGTVAHTLYNNMTVKSHQLIKQIGERISLDINCVGALSPYVLSDRERAVIVNRFAPLKETYTFKRICFHGHAIQSLSYKRVSKRNSYTICYNGRAGKSYGFVKHFLKAIFACPKESSCNLTCCCRRTHFLAVLDKPEVLNVQWSKDIYTNTTLDHMIDTYI